MLAGINGETNYTTPTNVTVPGDPYGETRLMWGFLIIAVLGALGGVGMVILHFVFNGIYVHGQSKSSKKADTDTPKELVPMRVLIGVLLMIFSIGHALSLRTFSNFILVFVVNYLGWTKIEGANITAAFQAGGTVSRIAMIIVVRKVPVNAILFGGLIICWVASLGLFFFIDVADAFVYMFMVILATGSVIPLSAVLAWIDDHIGLKGVVSVIFNMALGIGEMIHSPMLGFLFYEVSSISFVYYTLGATTTCLIMMLILWFLGKKYKQRKAALYDTL